MLYAWIDDESARVKEATKDYVHYVSSYFDEEFEQDWLRDPTVQELIRSIDNTVVLENNTLYNEVIGGIVPSQLSGGVKGLILLYKLGTKIDGDRLGDNCWEHVQQIAKEKDIYMVLRHIPTFPDDIEMYLFNIDKVATLENYVLTFCNIVK